MTQDEIIEMVKQSDLGFLLGDNWMMHHEFQFFAKLVADKAITELESQERNFCQRCGKRTNDIHTCTPPQRTWTGLTVDEVDDIANSILTDDPVLWWRKLSQAIEAKLKELNT